jgi:hypothetical protein
VAHNREFILKSFKQYNIEAIYPSSYETNSILNKLVDKHDDPLKFVLDVITHMSSGKLKLRRIGVANTREVVAYWNDKKKRQIKPSYVMDSYVIESYLYEKVEFGQIMWKDGMDTKNPEIQIFGFGVYTLDSLRIAIASKLEDLGKRLRKGTNTNFAWRQVSDPKEILHTMLGALNDAEEELNKPASKRKITMMSKK